MAKGNLMRVHPKFKKLAQESGMSGTKYTYKIASQKEKEDILEMEMTKAAKKLKKMWDFKI